MTRLQVKLLQGGANPFATTLGPQDELRVSYVNTFKQQGAGLATTLELLPDRIPVDLATSISVELPMWAFRRIQGVADESGAFK
jgi:hypothetical protein